jgi:hypothetical protein
MRNSGEVAVSAAQYRIVSSAGGEHEAGNCDVVVADGALTVTPAAGAALRVPFTQIASVTEPRAFTVSVALAGGNAVELTRLGAMRTQLLAELRDGRIDAAAAATVGRPQEFAGALGGAAATAAPAEIRVYEDALLIMAQDTPHRIAFSFIEGIEAQNYVVTVWLAGGGSLELSRLGPRTSELVSLVADRSREARGRTAAFLGALLPGLEPMALRAAAGLLRDGVAAPVRALDAIHPDLSRTLLEIATLPDRKAAADALARQTDLALGFRQLTSVRRTAAGGSPWRDPAPPPHIGGPFCPSWGYWAFRALGVGTASRPMGHRANVNWGLLTPQTEDLSALTAAGADPTVLAFALGRTPGNLAVYEALNIPEPMTFVYRADGDDGTAAINRALDNAGFAPAQAHVSGLTASPRPGPGSPVLASALVTTVPHNANWSDRITSLP